MRDITSVSIYEAVHAVPYVCLSLHFRPVQSLGDLSLTHTKCRTEYPHLIGCENEQYTQHHSQHLLDLKVRSVEERSQACKSTPL